uniref:Transposase n=1 Tax=Candidatus Kentrum sp. MB TaxID=2138164 RepID=A0A450X019_9GAMM|nr:MAG: hypothetical protein BECKMB1821G_GA0114241_100291 [Candidatus Kentron sp. MB]VFK32139.1 MAG: hypothetical protein BECKMB1821I_GA0114274_10305 [Candidatus Kentron sp. MB]VFK74164.1 MAG: hypothetical protein BECKMB1821H_GA0114242_100195 [Candidatus Kentron sp. MB]
MRKDLRKGDNKGRKEIARALLDKGMDIGEISDISDISGSGLLEEEIRKLSAH